MTMQEQIQMSGLEMMSSSSPLQWNSINHWSPLLGVGRCGQACVTIVSDNGVHPCENDAAAQTIVVLGGETRREWCSNSVILWDLSTMEWRLGPNLNDRRKRFVAVVCGDKVYAIGGCRSRGVFGSVFDTMESIQVSSLLETMETSTTRQDNSQWTRLQCRLSSPRQACAAVVVHNRYIVILGGDNGMDHHLSSVDVLDTAPPHNNNNNNGEPTIVAGPSMNSSRSYFGAAVIDNRIFVVGGWVNEMHSTSVESLLFRQDHTNSNSNASCFFPNSLWRVEPHLTLSTTHIRHAVAKVGSCLVVAGGMTGVIVEVLDVQRDIVWSLPNSTIERPIGCSMVALSDCLLVLGGNSSVDSVESLALTVYRKHERCYKFLKFLIEIEFLGRPNPERKRCIK